MINHIALAAIFAAVAGTATSCPTQPEGATGTGSTTGATVALTGYERNGPGDPGVHYAECVTPTGQRYRVVISAEQDYGGLREGAPCPHGLRLPMPDPATVKELQDALAEPLPYAGGNSRLPCGAWETRDKAEARQLAVTCGPVTRGNPG